MDLKSIFRNRSLVNRPEPGLYHFREKSSSGESRAHLRIQQDGSGMLMVNASRVYHFNPTAAFITYLVLNKSTNEQATRSLINVYQVSRKQAQRDYEQIAGQIRLMIAPGYDHVAQLIKEFSSFTEAEISAIKKIGKSLSIDEITQTILFINPDDSDELTSLIPVFLQLDKGIRNKVRQELIKNEQDHIASLITSLDTIESDLIERFDILSVNNSGMEIVDPIFDTIPPFSKKDLAAPYRMDLALTYQCNNRCHHCYNPADRHRNQLDKHSWKNVIDHLWDIGVPHIIFTGGEPTLRRDLPELIAHAESNGQITGINTNGRLLKNRQYLDELIAAGLDHIQITIESHDSQIHDAMVGYTGAWQETIAGIKNVANSRLYFMTNTTLLQNNYRSLRETLQFLAELGVQRVGLNALIYSGQGTDVGTGLPEKILPELLVIAREMTYKNNQKLTWYTPTQYCHFDPVLFDFETLGVKGCTAALYNMCIEPDGKVLPCQSYYQPVGHILNDPWEDIWNSELATSLRNRDHVTEECRECSLLAVCGGGCPLAYQAGKLSAPRTIHFLDA
jgi:radical SAM protein with 4Fe4S-binding SPASM domain